MLSNSKKADALARYVNTKILQIQHNYVDANGNKPQARASLAHLRKLVEDRNTNWATVGLEVFDEWPHELFTYEREEQDAIQTVCTALGLYAMHQQSQNRHVAQAVVDGEHPSISFGKACKSIGWNNDGTPKKGVVRRLAAAENAPLFSGKAQFLRALIQLMKVPNGPMLDYRRFTRDLYLLHSANTNNEVFQRWSRDFYYNSSQNK